VKKNISNEPSAISPSAVR